ncbi:MAG: hypothetical protein ABI840_09310 [bacterium]
MKTLIFTIVIAFAITGYSYSQVVQDWVKRYNGPADGPDEGSCVAVSENGNVYVTGVSASAADDGFLTIKYNSAGVIQWERRHGGALIPPGPKLFIDNLDGLEVN